MCVQCVGLCGYCDCRTLPVISRLSCEHASILGIADTLRAGLSSQARLSEPEAARDLDVPGLLGRLFTLLVEHGAYEERSLYHELRNDPTFVDTARSLCGEHLSIRQSLQRALDSTQPTAELVLPALTRLRRHIMKEERGLFPPAVILLGTEAWERAAAQA